MQLYPVRHAEAAQGDPDELRALTGSGRDQARRVGRRLRAAGVAPGVVLAGPIHRAHETEVPAASILISFTG